MLNFHIGFLSSIRGTIATTLSVATASDSIRQALGEHFSSSYNPIILLFCGLLIWAVIWGGAKRMGGGKRTRERALPKNFGPLHKSFWSALSWIFVQEKQSTDT